MSDREPDGRDLLLPPATVPGAPTLRVADVAIMSDYYERAFDLEPVEEGTVGRDLHRVLGRGAVPVMKLLATPELPLPGPHEAGLFHTAFLFPSAAELARTVHLAMRHPRTRFRGAADHLVSEAFYFRDPEGNGVELYADRPREKWLYDGGQIVVATKPLDRRAFLREHLDLDHLERNGSSAARVGHVHLQVGDIEAARPFYVDALGFAITQSRYPGALFASAGGYHHHVALNIWNSRGAGLRAATLGLGEMVIEVPDRSALEPLRSRLRAHRLEYVDDGEAVTVDDPWGTRIRVSAAG